MAGTVADERTCEFFPQRRQHNGRRGVCRRSPPGPVGARRSALPLQSSTRTTSLAFVLAGVGEEGVVGGIDEAGVRPRFYDLAENGSVRRGRSRKTRMLGAAVIPPMDCKVLWRVANGLNQQRLANPFTGEGRRSPTLP